MLKIKKLFLALTIIIISASPGWAEDWVRAASSYTTDHYLDTDSVRKRAGYVYAWELMNYVEPTKSGDLSTKSYLKIDCDSFGYQYLTIEYYDSHWAKGKRTQAGPPTHKLKGVHYPRSGSTMEYFVETACKLAK